MEHLERGDAWIMEGSPTPINFGNNANGGIPVEERSPWVRWEEIRKGGADPAVRLLEQDEERCRCRDPLSDAPDLAQRLRQQQ